MDCPGKRLLPTLHPFAVLCHLMRQIDAITAPPSPGCGQGSGKRRWWCLGHFSRCLHDAGSTRDSAVFSCVRVALLPIPSRPQHHILGMLSEAGGSPGPSEGRVRAAPLSSLPQRRAAGFPWHGEKSGSYWAGAFLKQECHAQFISFKETQPEGIIRASLRTQSHTVYPTQIKKRGPQEHGAGEIKK